MTRLVFCATVFLLLLGAPPAAAEAGGGTPSVPEVECTWINIPDTNQSIYACADIWIRCVESEGGWDWITYGIRVGVGNHVGPLVNYSEVGWERVPADCPWVV